MNVTNPEIRNALKKHGISLWQLAIALECHESTVIRHLRTELPPNLKRQYLTATAKIAENQQKEEDTYEED